MTTSIDVKNTSISFKQKDQSWRMVTRGISFTLSNGKTLAMVGESGSGKSVTALSLLRLLPENIGVLSEGTITYTRDHDSIDYHQHPEEWEALRGKGIAIVFQNAISGLNPTITCGNQMRDVLAMHNPSKDSKKFVQQLFEEVKLPEPNRIFSSYPHQLSGGQLQRVMIAMALACEPAFLIADEPTTALDPSLQLEILELLNKIQEKRGLGMLFITHDLQLIKSFAHEIGVMYGGELVDYGTVDEILNNSQNDYTKALLKCKPSIDFKQSHLPTVEEYLNNNIAPITEAKEREIRWGEVPVLEAKHLYKYYEKKKWLGKNTIFKAVDGVNIEVFENEVVGIVGESGSGKSTVAQMLCGLITPTKGEIKYKGSFVLEQNRACLKKWAKSVQLIFQDPYSSLNPKHTIINQVKEVIHVHKTRKTNKEQRMFARELLKRVGLDEELFDRYPFQLSGGQLQRASIARALAVEPKVIICDESVSALDVSIQANILNLLKKLKEVYNLSFIFIAHDMGVVRYFCDRVMVMQHGNVVEEGLVSQVFDYPKHPYTQQLIRIAKKLV
ncbi:MAG: peptide/nickel transport system ATP-binding protein [Flavobacteriales bacterium]|jgi:peptide/nickel transport system ATP-binding protein